MDISVNIVQIYQMISGNSTLCRILFAQPFTLAFQKSCINFFNQQSDVRKDAANENNTKNALKTSHSINAGNENAIIMLLIRKNIL